MENKNTIMDRLNETDIAKYTIKDSVFTNLFQDKKYRVESYHNACYDGVYPAENCGEWKEG